MNAHALHRLQARIAARGLTPAGWIPEASEGRAVEAAIQPARLIEDEVVSAHPVGAPAPWPGPVAFLDGTQRYEFVAHAGASTMVVATIAAAIRLREGRRLRTVKEARRAIAVGRAATLALAGEALDGLDQVILPDEGPVHPVRDLLAARRAVDRERGRLETSIGADFTVPEQGWLVVDGSLSDSPTWAASPRTVGIAKSHAILPFEGRDLETYLGLAPGHRSSVFAPAKSQVAPVYSWALRLWPWAGKDLFYGLIRVEARAAPETVGTADRISCWLLAERAPLSAPDARWDRLLYGVRDVESYLKAGGRQGA